MTLLYPLLFGLAMFAASNLVSIPVGFISGFREARKHPLSRRAAATLELVESAAEMAVMVAITVKLIHTGEGNPLGNVAQAYGLLVVLEAVALRILRLSTPAKWMRILATMSVAAAISVAIA